MIYFTVGTTRYPGNPFRLTLEVRDYVCTWDPSVGVGSMAASEVIGELPEKKGTPRPGRIRRPGERRSRRGGETRHRRTVDEDGPRTV